MSGADEVRAQALEVADGWSPPGAPGSWRLTAALFESIAADDDLLQRLAVLPAGRLSALLASAAVAFLVRRDRPVPLAGYFPEPGGSQSEFNDGFFPAFGAFCAARLDDIVEVCRGHRYQMNEVARCTQIVLGIAAASSGFTDPVALIDLGTGAGLGLQLDRYRYRIGTGTYGPAAAGLSLACDVRGPIIPPPAELPRIAGRVGVDLDPVDLEDPAARAWLQACAPPEASALSRLSAAVDIARRNPARIVAGDVVDVLPRVLDSIPQQQCVTVIDAYMAVFLFDGGGDRGRLLARAHPSGGWIEWLSP